MTKGSREEWVPPTVEHPTVYNVHKPGDKGSAFYQSRHFAKYDGSEPKAELALLRLLATKAALVVMSCLLVAAVATVLVLLLVRL